MHVTPRNVSPHQTRFPAGICLSGVHTDGSSPPAAAQHTSPQPSSLGAGTGREDTDSPSNSPSGFAQRAAGRLAGLRTSPVAPWRHCGSWRGSVSAAGRERRQREAPEVRPVQCEGVQGSEDPRFPRGGDAQDGAGQDE